MAPSTANPPSLPPTVEEAYRRKCIQLRARTKEIEDENDAYRLRLTRLKRQIQKVRLERAILLEQIAKRTSTNVEDSDGSPSPPPTPEDKPLRNKRGHRKHSIPSIPGGTDHLGLASAYITRSLRGHSPVSEFSHGDQVSTSGRGANGIIVPKPPKRPSNAFEIYCKDMRPLLQSKNKESIAAGEFRLEEELARGWKDLPEKEKDEFQTRYEQELAKWKEERSVYRSSTKGGRGGREFDIMARTLRGGRRSAGGARRSVTAQDDDADELDNDVEMGDVEAAEAEEPEQGEPNETDPETEVEDGEDAEN